MIDPASDAAPAFRCPVCQDRLEPVPGGLGCAAGHRFDRAREGYVHLLPPGRAARAGDDAAAVRARRAVFDRGHYRPVQEAVAEVAGRALAAGAPTAEGADPGAEPGGPQGRHVLDAGCGEGTYLAAVVAATGATGWGIDVSKPAVRLAARRHPEHRYAVASSHRAPFGDGVFDVVLSVFSPRPFAEFHRLLCPGGSVVLASPGPDHLDGVRALAGRQAREEGPRRHVSGAGVPAPEERVRVRYELVLTDPAEIADLLAMTPWRDAAAGRRVPAGGLRTTVDVWVTRHARPPSGSSSAGATV